MRLEVFWPLGGKRNTEKTSTFHAVPTDGTTRRSANSAEILKLKIMQPHINTVCKKVLGDDFINTILNTQLGRLEIVMEKGITQKRKRDFVSLRGWIELCCIEDR